MNIHGLRYQYRSCTESTNPRAHRRPRLWVAAQARAQLLGIRVRHARGGLVTRDFTRARHAC